MTRGRCPTLVELLRARAQSQPDRLAYSFLTDGATAEARMTYGELDRQARAIAVRLAQTTMPGERALLLYPPGLEFIAAFFGALYAGLVAVPAYPPHAARLERALPRLQGIARDAQPAAALTTRSLLGMVERLRGSATEFHGIRTLTTDQLDTRAERWRVPAIDAETLAVLQYTSGSTGTPRGVMLTHGNLLHNQEMIHAAFGRVESSIAVGWLPLYHDMGLIGNVLQTLYVGGWCILMSPVAFLQRPLRWLEAISRFRATICGGPNFAYDLCVRKISPEQRAGLDLSSWTLAYTGAEPISAATLERFAEAFAPCGFRREAFYPCYGLAEATLLVTGGEPGVVPTVRHLEARALGQNAAVAMPAAAPGSTAFVSCGRSAADQSVLIVEPETRRECAPGRIGEIWVAGPSVARGYWNRPEETAAVFGAELEDGRAGRYLRTGDLGFLAEGELYVTGRLKDLLIIRGRNHYPQDIEATVERSHPWVRGGTGAACAVEVEGEERVVILQEVERRHCRAPAADLERVMLAIRAAVAAEHEVEVFAMRLVGPGGIPKTSSGKIQRHACRAQFLAGSFDTVAEWTSTPDMAAEGRRALGGGAEPSARVVERIGKTAESIQAWLISRLSERLQRAPETLDPRGPFSDYGLDSLGAVSLSGDLEEWLGQRLSPTLAWEYPSIEALARHLSGEESPVRGRGDAEATAEPIAIIGVGCRFPGAGDAASFWRLLRDGTDAVREVPVDRWDALARYDADPGAPGKMNTRWGGFLDEIDRFDAGFFGIAPREAVRMDPQQRLLLEVAWEALHDGGQAPGRLAGSRTGVFVGVSTSDYGLRQMEEEGLGDAYAGTGSALSIAANRISYLLNLRGPSLAVDTACSSSLVAVHLACASLRSGESTLALCGGVNVILSPLVTVNFTKGGFMSPDGRCKAFDARANGYVRGEGAGIVVLKPLSRALADGDPIYAVIRGSAVNQDGRSNGLTAPNPEAQEAVLAEAWQRAGVSPGLAQYVEAHGTGTLLGDPIEARALGRVVAEGRPPGLVCALGSVKTNIGHLEAAAGIAGLIKVALALRHREIPASLHFETPNQHIPFAEMALRVQRERGPWPDPERRLIAGVSSFGFGGTNAHVVLEEAPDPAVTPGAAMRAVHARDDDRRHLLPLSAHTHDALRAVVASYRDFLGDSGTGAPALHDICFTAGARRDHHDHRLALVGRTKRELVDQLERFLRDEPLRPAASGRTRGGRAPKIALVFSGQGAQWPGMAADLLGGEPSFREAIEHADALLRPHVEWSLLEELRGDPGRPHETERAQPTLVALEVALAALWRRWGIAPGAVVGHSMGEIAAACVAGALSTEEALALAARRGGLMQRQAGRGKMAAVELSAEDARCAVAPYGDRLAVAAWNAPTSTVLSGEPAALEEMLASLAQRRVVARVLPGDVAFHSPQMAQSGAELARALADLRPRPATLGLVSTVTGREVDGLDLTAEYWGRNAREPVRFAEAIEGLLDDGYDAFVEIGPHPVLSPAIAECARRRGREVSIVHSLRRQQDASLTMLESVAALYCAGAVPDWAALCPVGGAPVALPLYPWQRERFWVDAVAALPAASGAGSHPLLGARLGVAQPTWDSRLARPELAYLDEHRVDGRAVLSASAGIEMALAAAAEVSGGDGWLLEGVDFPAACVLPEGRARALQTALGVDDSSFTICGAPSQGERSWTVHVQGTVRALDEAAAAEALDLGELRARCSREVPRGEVYRALSAAGLEYGPGWRGIERLWRGDADALGLIQAPEGIAVPGGPYLFHPALLDACFQVIAGVLIASGDGESHAGRPPMYLPVALRRARVYRRGTARLWSHVVLEARTADRLVARVRVFDDAGRPVLDAEGLACRAIDRAPAAAHLDELVYEHRWRPRALPTRAPVPLPAPGAIAETVSVAAGGYATELGLNARYAALEPELDALCAAYILKAFRDLGGAPTPGERLSVAALGNRLGIAPRHRRLLDRYLEILGEDGHLRRVGAEWEVGAEVPAPAPGITWRGLLARYPAFYGELVLLERCASRLGEILRGECDPLALIFPDGSLAAAEQLYQDAPSTRLSNALVGRAIAALVAALPAGRQLRVLEIGAGTGGVTAHALPALPDEARYVFTDVSPQFLGKAEEKFRRYPGVEYRRLDIEADPIAQGFQANTFDLVLASQVLHATTDLRRTLSHVGTLLASEGWLVLLETVRPARWVDLVFGLTEGWWRFADRDLRPGHPLLSLRSWRGLLAEAGFGDVQEASGRPEDAVENAVILARGPRIESAAPVPRPAQSATGGELGRWVVFADRGGIGERVVRALSARGARCLRVFAASGYRRRGADEIEMSPGSAADMERVLREALGQGGEACRGIIHLWNLDAPPPDRASTEDLESAQTAGSTSVVHVVQALASVDDAAPRLWLVTRGAEAVGDAAAPVSVAQAPAWGLGRVIASEMPRLRATLVDLGADPGDAEIRALVDEVAADDSEGEIALRDGVRHVHRYVRRPEGTRRIVPMGAAQCRLEISTPGRIDGLRLVAVPRREPQAGEVELEVVAAALNWSDVMKSLGLAPPSPDATPILGLECSGRVSRVGPDVEGFRVGSEVIAIAPHSLAPFVTTGAGYVALKPPHVSFEEAATIPIAFLTASYALRHLGRLAPGERVLIHSAAGGVGLAAMQLAARAGAEIFATAGTPEKRGLLRALGIRHVMDSRSTVFADAILDETRGAGVDLVLNSLTGEAIARGLSVLSDYGRFLEIGKHDISRNSRLGLAPFEKNLSFFGIDLDRALRDRPRLMSALFRELVSELGAGALAPLPHRVFPISNAAGAFRYMATAQHIGKVVVSLEEREAMVAVPPPARPLLREDATYLISGGLGGFGLTLARWMVEGGARHLVLMGRRGDDADEARSAVMALRRAGAEVVVAAADVTRGADVARVLRDIEAAMPPLRGVAHAAMVLEDSLLVNLDEARFDRVRAPKMSGAWNLHTQTLGAPLDFFVLFSSMSSVFGIPGQASYAAANAFVDALAHHRRARGLPALAVNWGYLGEVGWVARQPAVAARLEGQGVDSFSPGEALAVLDRLLSEDAVQAGVMRIDWLRWAAASGPAPISPRFAQLVQAAAGQSRREQAGLDRRALLAASPEERRARLLTYLRAQVGRVLGLPAGQVDVEQPVGRLGLDSLMAVELRNRLEADLGIGLAAVTLLEGPSVAALTTDLLTRLDEDAPPAPRADSAAPVRAGGTEAPLSSAQRWMWVLHQLGSEQPWCNVPLALRLGGPLDVPALERSLGEIARRHEVLRTRFPMVEDRPVSRVVPDPGVALAVTDLGGLPEPEREARARHLAAEESRRPFDLEGGPVWRAGLIRLGERDHVLVVTMHHVVADAWSFDVVLRELEALYPAFRAGRPSPLAELPIQYADFARWEQARLTSESLAPELEYWTRRLADAPAALELPTDHRRTAEQAYRAAAAHLALPAELVAPLRELGRAEGATLYMTLLAAFDTLLFRYTGQDDLTVGSFTSTRTRPEWNGLVGCFVNHLVLRADLSGNPTFRELLGRVREATLGAYAHQDVPFEMLLDALSVRRDSSRTPLFQVAFAFDPALRLALPDLTVADLGLDDIHSNFDVTLRIREDGAGASAPINASLNMTVEYNARLFEAVTIERLLRAFRALVAGIGVDPDQKIAALPLLSAADHRELLAGGHDAPEPAPRGGRPGAALESIAAEKLRLARRKRAPRPGGEASMKGT